MNGFWKFDNISQNPVFFKLKISQQTKEKKIKIQSWRQTERERERFNSKQVMTKEEEEEELEEGAIKKVEMGEDGGLK